MLTLEITPFTFPALRETTDDTFLDLESLQHLLNDTLSSVLYIYSQIDKLLLIFSSASLTFTVAFLQLALARFISHIYRGNAELETENRHVNMF